MSLLNFAGLLTTSTSMHLPKVRQVTYSKVFIERPGCSRLLEFEKKDSTGRLIETFSKYPDQVV